MRTLKQILREFYVPADVLGDDSEINHRVQDLNELRNDLNKRTWLLTIILLLLFLVSLGITLFHLDKPKLIVSIFSGLGISTGWIITEMNKLWKEVARINLIIILCRSLEPTEIHNIIKTLIKSGFTPLKK